MENISFIHKLTKSEFHYFYIQLSRNLEIPSKFKIHIKDREYNATCDDRHRVYITGFLNRDSVKIGQTIEFVRKNGEYYFTVK